MVERKLFVSLECTAGENGNFEALGEAALNTYKFRLAHKCACWDGCKSDGNSISVEVVLIILLLLFIPMD
jgi:hypothetical protein